MGICSLIFTLRRLSLPSAIQTVIFTDWDLFYVKRHYTSKHPLYLLLVDRFYNIKVKAIFHNWELLCVMHCFSSEPLIYFKCDRIYGLGISQPTSLQQSIIKLLHAKQQWHIFTRWGWTVLICVSHFIKLSCELFTVILRQVLPEFNQDDGCHMSQLVFRDFFPRAPHSQEHFTQISTATLLLSLSMFFIFLLCISLALYLSVYFLLQCLRIHQDSKEFSSWSFSHLLFGFQK